MIFSWGAAHHVSYILRPFGLRSVSQPQTCSNVPFFTSGFTTCKVFLPTFLLTKFAQIFITNYTCVTQSPLKFSNDLVLVLLRYGHFIENRIFGLKVFGYSKNRTKRFDHVYFVSFSACIAMYVCYILRPFGLQSTSLPRTCSKMCHFDHFST